MIGGGESHTHRDEDPNSRRVAVDADDLDGAALRSSRPVLDRSPDEDGKTEAVGVAVKWKSELVSGSGSSQSSLHDGSSSTETGEIVGIRRAGQVCRDRGRQGRSEEEGEDEGRRNPERTWWGKGEMSTGSQGERGTDAP
jgi:hypothetical protein